jgi:SIR2-like domain
MSDSKAPPPTAIPATHDPRREIEKIRDHLGANDGRLAFLIGAGASAAVKRKDREPLIPTVEALGENVRVAVAALDKPDETQLADSYAAIEAECQEALEKRAEPGTRARAANVEDVLSSVRTKLSAIGPTDRIADLDRVQLGSVEKTIRKTIAQAAVPDDEDVPSALPHAQFARWVKRLGRADPIEIFTTNYDTLLERSLEDQRVPVFDGFIGARTPFFYAASLERRAAMPGAAWTRLWKIHGSVNWSMAKFSDGRKRISRGVESEDGELIFPSLQKYDESRKQPYVAILDHLGRTLTSPGGTLLVVLGYSFGDQHINEIIFDALEDRDGAHVFAFQYTELGDQHPLIARARDLPNLLVYGPETAVLGGIRRPWRLTEPVEDHTARLLDIPFDSKASPESEQGEFEGLFQLGDFSSFAEFLGALAGDDD